VTAFGFKRISDAIITSYPAKDFLTGALHAKVTKFVDKHDSLLRYALFFSKNILGSIAFNKSGFNNNNNNILLRTHGPYHRHKSTKSG